MHPRTQKMERQCAGCSAAGVKTEKQDIKTQDREEIVLRSEKECEVGVGLSLHNAATIVAALWRGRSIRSALVASAVREKDEQIMCEVIGAVVLCKVEEAARVSIVEHVALTESGVGSVTTTEPMNSLLQHKLGTSTAAAVENRSRMPISAAADLACDLIFTAVDASVATARSTGNKCASIEPSSPLTPFSAWAQRINTFYCSDHIYDHD